MPVLSNRHRRAAPAGSNGRPSHCPSSRSTSGFALVATTDRASRSDKQSACASRANASARRATRWSIVRPGRFRPRNAPVPDRQGGSDARQSIGRANGSTMHSMNACQPIARRYSSCRPARPSHVGIKPDLGVKPDQRNHQMKDYRAAGFPSSMISPPGACNGLDLRINHVSDPRHSQRLPELNTSRKKCIAGRVSSLAGGLASRRALSHGLAIRSE